VLGALSADFARGHCSNVSSAIGRAVDLCGDTLLRRVIPRYGLRIGGKQVRHVAHCR
jgi:hypothetical protein